MKFESWLIKQKHRDDPIGDLAKDFISAKIIREDRKCNKEMLDKWGACQAAYDALDKAKQEYNNTQKKVKVIKYTGTMKSLEILVKNLNLERYDYQFDVATKEIEIFKRGPFCGVVYTPGSHYILDIKESDNE